MAPTCAYVRHAYVTPTCAYVRDADATPPCAHVRDAGATPPGAHGRAARERNPDPAQSDTQQKRRRARAATPRGEDCGPGRSGLRPR